MVMSGTNTLAKRRRRRSLTTSILTISFISVYLYLNIFYIPKHHIPSFFSANTNDAPIDAPDRSHANTIASNETDTSPRTDPVLLSNDDVANKNVVVPGCLRGAHTVWHRPGSKLAQWTKDYFDWHHEVRCGENDPGESLKKTKYLVVQCLRTMKCGGTADRLQPLPIYVWHAARMKRVLLFQWDKPHPLEEFLVPQVGGINWIVPEWLHPELSLDDYRINSVGMLAGAAADNKNTVLKATVQTYAHSILVHYNEERTKADPSSDTNPSYDTVFRDVFRAFFTPSPPIRNLISETMTRHGLTPNDYVTAHIRARYPAPRLRAVYDRHDKEGGFPFLADNELRRIVVPIAVNAVNCAGFILPRRPVYVASDSDDVVRYLVNDSEFTKYIETNDLTLTSIPHTKEPLHLETSNGWDRPPEDYYSVFVDLWILAQARCTAYGMGGFGRLGMYMSYNATCSANHRKFNGRVQRCPSLVDTLKNG